MYGYIYLWINLITDGKYVGKHKYPKLEWDPNYLTSGELIQEKIKEYGIENFKRVMLDTCDTLDELNEAEKYWIAEFETYIGWNKGGYNKTLGGDGFSGKHTEEWKQNMSIRNSGENNAFYGHHHTEESNKRNSETNRRLYAEGKKVVWNKDKPGCFSDKTRKQMSDTKKTQYASGEVVAWNKDKTDVYSDEVLREMGNGRRGKKPHNKIEVDLDLIKKMYLEDKSPVSKIADALNVKKDVIRSRLKELGIYNPDPRFQGKKITIDKDILYDLYCVQKKSIKTISKLLDKKYDMILSHLKLYGLYYS